MTSNGMTTAAGPAPYPATVWMRPRRLAWAIVCLAILVLAAASARASADPMWEINPHHGPSTFTPGGTGEYTFFVNNIGNESTSGPVYIDVRLPSGVTTRPHAIGFCNRFFCETATAFASPFDNTWTCPNVVGESSVRCEMDLDRLVPGVEPLAAGTGRLGRLTVYVQVPPDAEGELVAVATVSGGGADTVAAEEAAPVGEEPAEFGVVESTFFADAFDRDGNQERQAGSHPFRAVVGFDFRTRNTVQPVPFVSPQFFISDAVNPIGTPRNLEVTLPRGFIGNPQAVAQCTAVQLRTKSGQEDAACPANSQVGTIELAFQSLNGPGRPAAVIYRPVYNMVPPRGVVAAFAFQIVGRPVYIYASLDPEDYSIVTRIGDINESLPVHHQRLTLWGVPGDPVHDSERWNGVPGAGGDWGAPFTGEVKPFLTLPSECDVPGVTKLKATSWQGAADPPADAAARGARHVTEPQRLHGCEKQEFRASLRATPDTGQVDAPTGLGVQLSAHQDQNPLGLGTPPLNKAVVRLPEGMSVSPSSATGLGGCALDQIKLKTNDEPTCPDPSKIGTVSITTPLLPDPLTGGVYLARQRENPFGSLLAIYLVVRGPGVIVKLPGEVKMDQSTGQLTAVFNDNPQLPFTSLDLQFKGGPRGALATPTSCGPKTTTTELTPWNALLPTAVSTSTFDATYDGHGAACPAQQSFDPSVEAGMVNPVAGKDSTFTLTFGRPDRHQYLNDITVKMPPGLTGRIADATLCTDQQANAGACPEDSKIGTSTVASGPGSSPFWLSGGRAYITRSYKGAPYGLAVVVRVLAGPFDLGQVIVRAAIHVDPATAALTVVSDPVPSMLEGIPLRIRTVNIAIDRPGFMLNPTGCSPKSIDTRITSTTGAAADRSTRFQVGSCRALPIRPRMTIDIGRRGHVGREATTPLKVTLSQTRGQGNLRSVKVDLPTTVNARLRVVNQACRLTEFEAGRCGARALIGSAVAITPLLRDPLRGQAFFVRNPARRLPDIMVALRGDVSVNLTGKVTIPGGRRLATTFDTIPDVPISSFTLRLVDGSQGPVGAVSNLCLARNRRPPARVEYIGHNGTVLRVDQRMRINGCGRGRAVARGRRGASRRGRSRRATGRGRRARRSS